MASKTLFGKFAWAYPKQLGWLQANLAATPTSPQHLQALKSALWRARIEFWSRKISTYPQVVQAAKAESKELFKLWSRPTEWTGADLTRAVLFSVQVYGAFCLGEMFGRESLVGYPVGDYHHPFGHEVPGIEKHH